MADVKFSGIGVVAMNGSIGNTTFSRNFYGAYAKTRLGAPASTPFLSNWQFLVGITSNIWTVTLNDFTRQLWYNITTAFKDDLGMSHRSTGFNLFMTANLNLQLIGMSPIYAPPLQFTKPPQIKILISSVLPNHHRLTIQSSSVFYCAVYISASLSVGRMSNNQIYFFLAAIQSDNTPHDLYPLMLARFGSVINGSKYFVKVVPIENNDGSRGIPKYLSFIN